MGQGRLRTLLLLGLALSYAVPRAGAQTSFSAAASVPSSRSWIGRDSMPMPSARRNAAVGYDTRRGRVLLFGGTDGTTRQSDTWEWDGFTWNQKSPSSVPAARDGARMAFDTVREKFVLFGGQTDSALSQETWEWDGSNWASKASTSKPSARTGVYLAYDSKRGRTILFGGFDCCDFQRDTWSWDGTGWTFLGTFTSLSGRYNGGACYDSNRDRVVLFGGQAGSSPQSDLLEYDGTSWSVITPGGSAPSARTEAGLVYDLVRERSTLFGGALAGGTVTTQTWDWNGSAWTQRSLSTSPAARRDAMMAFDVVRQRSVLFGGHDGSAALRDTWEFDGSDWMAFAGPISTKPQARHGAAFGYDSSRKTLVVFGGRTSSAELSDTWEWGGEKWIQRSPATNPSARRLSPAAYDANKGKLLLFGGYDGTSNLSDTWEYDGTNWTAIAATSAPSARSGGSMTFDSSRNECLLFAGNHPLIPATFVFSGTTWTERTGTQPSKWDRAALAYDSARSKGVVFAGEDSDETWEWLGTSWQQKSPSTKPSGRHGHHMTFDDVRDRVLMHAGILESDNSGLSDSWEWDGTNWSQLPLSSAPTAAGLGAFAFDSQRRRTVRFGGITSETGTNLTETWELPSATPPTLSSATYTAASPAPGQAIGLSATATSPVGIAPSYRWTQLAGTPGTFSSTTTAVSTFTPAANGTVVLMVTASDGSTGFTFATTSFQVAAPAQLAIRTVSTTPASVVRGQTGLAVSVTIANTGGATVHSIGSGLTFSGSGYTVTPGSNPTTLSANTTATFTYTVDAGGSATLGATTIDATVTGTDAVSAAAVSDTSADATDTWTVVTAAGLSIVSAGTTPTAVSRGQGGIPLTVRVANTGGSAASISAAGLSFAGGDDVSWRRKSPSSKPSVRFRQGMAYDAARQKTLLFSGLGAADDTWLWDGTNWVEQNPSPRPAAREGMQIAYDSSRQRVVLFGGSGNRQDTWEWDGTSWTQISPATRPLARRLGRLAYDETLSHSVLFGGLNDGGAGLQNDTWSWDGTTWSQRSPASSPSGRHSFSMAYDSSRQRTVIFGGATSGGRVSETWEWDGSDWSRKSPATSPNARDSAAMVYDPGRRCVLLFGGASVSGNTGDTWKWDGASWTQLSAATSPPARSGAQAVYDSARQRTVLFGGSGDSGSLDDTWELGPGDVSSSYTATADGGNPITVPAGATATFRFTVDVGNSAPLGDTTIDATVTATDSVTGADASDGSADSADSWIVQAPAALAFGALAQPVRVSQGQVFSASVVVTNTGGATADLTSTALTYSGSGLTAVASGSNPTTLSGGVSATFEYSVTAAGGATTGPLTATFSALAKDRNSGADASLSQALSPSLMVQSPPSLAFGPLSAPVSVTQGQVFSASATVSNTGGATADITSTALTFSPGGLTAVPSASNPVTLAGGVTQTFSYTITATAGAAAGARTASLEVQAKDTNSSLDASRSQALSPGVTVLTAAQLQIRSVSATLSTVTRGQSGVSVVVDIANTGQTPADVGSTAITFSGSGYTVTPGSNPITIAAGTTSTFTYAVDVGAQATAGPIALDATATAVDSVTGADASDTSADVTDTWTVVTPAELAIRAVRATPAFVTRGQTGIAVSVEIANAGSTQADVTASGLTFSGGGFSVAPGSNPITIAALTTATFTYAVDVGASATLGPIALDAAVTADDSITGANASDTSADVADGWTVLTPARLSVLAVSAAPSTVSRGQTGIALSVSLENSGQTTAVVLAVTPTFGGVSSGYSVLPAAANPARLAGNETASYAFTVDVLAGAVTGTIQLDASAGGTDFHTGADASASGAALADSWTVQSAAALSFVSLGIPAPAARGSTITVTAAVSNIGQALLNLDSASLAFDRPELAVTPEPGNPASIAGGSSASLRFLVDVPLTVPTASSNATFTARGTDANSGAQTSLSQPAAGSLLPRNNPPTASIAGPAARPVAQAVPLDGSASFDGPSAARSEGDALTYRWTLAGKPPASALSDSSIAPNGTTSALAALVPDRKGGYRVGLSVDDGHDVSPIVEAAFTVPNSAPIARAGSDVSVEGAEEGRFDASATSDADPDDTLTYAWRLAAKPAQSQLGDSAIGGAATPNLTLSPDRPGTYTLELTASDGVESSTDSVDLVAGNGPPTARISAPAAATATRPVILDGSASSDPEDKPITYRWRLASVPPSSRLTAGSLAQTPRTGFLADRPGAYVVELEVHDGFSASPVVTATVRVANDPPAAAVSGPGRVPFGEAVGLDGTASSDPEGGPLFFSWRLVSVPPGSATTVLQPNDSARAGRTSFQPDRKGVYSARLVVDDGVFSSQPATFAVTVANTPPVARVFETDLSQPAGTAFAFDARSSFDPDAGDALAYRWSVLDRPASSSLADAAIEPAGAPLAQVTPDVPGSYRIALTVRDPDGATSTTVIALTARNTPPVARVSTPVLGSLTGPAILDGSRSSDDETPGAIVYHWRLLSVPAASALTAGAIAPSGTAGASRARLRPDRKGAYVFQLTLADPFDASEPVTGTVVVPNSLPVASAPALVVATVDAPVAIDGAASSDADPEDTVGLSWRLIRAPKSSRLPANAPVPDGPFRVLFTPDIEGTYVIRLVASDGSSSSQPFQVTVVAASRDTGPFLAGIAPSRVFNSGPASVTLFGAGLDGLERVTLSGPLGAATTAAVSLPFSLTATGVILSIPEGLAAGSYELAARARGLLSPAGGPRLAVEAPPPIVLQPGESPLLTYGAEEDREDDQSGIQATVQLVAVNLPPGTVLTLFIEEIGAGAGKLGKVVQAVVDENGNVRFPIDVQPGRSYVVEIRDESAGRVARAVLSRDGPPVALADSDAVDGAGPQIVRLDASGSRTPAPPLLYGWRLLEGPVGAASLDSQQPVTTYRALLAGAYRIGVTVSDTRGVLATSAVEFRVVNVPPTAAAPDRLELILPDPQGRLPSNRTTTSIELDGRGSRDANGDSLEYRWELLSKPVTSQVVAARDLSGARSAVARLQLGVALDDQGGLVDAGEYLLSLTVRDPAGASSSRVVRVLAVDPGTLIPSADAGLDRSVRATLLSTSPVRLESDIPDPLDASGSRRIGFVRLDGRESADPNLPPKPLAFSWSVLSVPPGSSVTGLEAATSTFPSFVPDAAGTYRFGLVVSNGRFESARDEVAVAVGFRSGNRPPRVQAIVWDAARGLSSQSALRLLTFLAGWDRVTLDGSLSSDPDPGDRISYEWQQTGGPPASLAPGPSADSPTFVPLAPGVYTFRLQVTDLSGTSDTSPEVSLVAVDPANLPPSLSLAATSPATSARGQDYEPFNSLATPRSLRVRVGQEVVLTAAAADGDVPDRQQVVTSIRQIAGPTVLLLRDPGPAGLASVARFVPTTSRVHVFEAQASERDLSGVETGTFVLRHIRVVVDSDTNSVPVARASPFGPKDEVKTCMTVSLNGNSSADSGPNSTQGLLYRWVQTGGPAVTLSNPFSSVLTFVAPDFPDDKPRQYRFQLFVDDGADRSEPSPLSLVVAPASARAAQLDLGRGLNLVTLPLDPGGAQPFRLSDLLRLSGASYAVSLDPGRRFKVLGKDAPEADRPVRGAEAVLLVRPAGPVMSIDVGGKRWPAQAARRRLLPGLNALGYPRGLPPDEDAERLRRRTGASYVVESVQGEDGRQSFRAYVPGLTQPFPIREGRAYLLSIPAEIDVMLPGCE